MTKTVYIIISEWITTTEWADTCREVEGVFAFRESAEQVLTELESAIHIGIEYSIEEHNVIY